MHKQIHTGKKPYKCNVCGAKFSNFADLNRHNSTHVLKKLFKCILCGKDFAWVSWCQNMNTHKWIPTNKRKFKCGICGEEFRKNGNLPKHQRNRKI
ncbi:zinc finger, C2H2 type [Onchocerca flexuosa]|uniref:Zinc finger, C2H2 type n=1 Tax=Onchocerca flexuosa TaxID=387005 RepID=A0A238BP18_9BILA|nr:zinc finger, C2H2 type [Onchocerca flexuosa]